MKFEIQDGVLQKGRLNTGETEAIIPEGVKSIGDRAFYQNQLLQSIMIPEGVTSIGKDSHSGECHKHWREGILLLQQPAEHHHSG